MVITLFVVPDRGHIHHRGDHVGGDNGAPRPLRPGTVLSHSPGRRLQNGQRSTGVSPGEADNLIQGRRIHANLVLESSLILQCALDQGFDILHVQGLQLDNHGT